MQVKDISVGKKYTTKNGEEKVSASVPENRPILLWGGFYPGMRYPAAGSADPAIGFERRFP